jgi:hypothetical protein
MTGSRVPRRTRGDLTALAQHFGTDKWGKHHYTPHYQRHLESYRGRPINLLEIGIGGYQQDGRGGASLRMWKHYFPKAQIFGLDLFDKSFVDEPRIRTFMGSQTDAELLQRIVREVGSLDVVIDDGSHRPEHVIETFQILFPLLADGGTYVVEDTQTSYWPDWGGSVDLHDATTSMAFLKRLADGLNYEEFEDEHYQPSYTDQNIVGLHFYKNLVFIEKGRNAEGKEPRAFPSTRSSQRSD